MFLCIQKVSLVWGFFCMRIQKSWLHCGIFMHICAVLIICIFIYILHSPYERKNVQCLWVCLIFRSVISNFIHFPSTDVISFFMDEYNSTVYIDHIFCFSDDWHLGWFHNLTVVNSVRADFCMWWFRSFQVYT